MEAVAAYREWDEARTLYNRLKTLSKGKYYEHASPRVREDLRNLMKQAQERCEAAQRRRDSVLRKLKPCGVLLGLDPATSPPDSPAHDDAGKSLSTMQEYVDEVREWLGNVRPQLENLVAQRRTDACHSVTSRANGVMPSQDIAQHTTPIQSELDRLEDKISSLEDFREDLRDILAGSLDRVDQYFPPANAERQEAGLSAAEKSLANMNSQLVVLHQQVKRLPSQPKSSQEIELQRLRAEQATLKLRMMEVSELRRLSVTCIFRLHPSLSKRNSPLPGSTGRRRAVWKR